MRRPTLWVALLALSAPAALYAEEKTFTVTYSTGRHTYKNVPICVPLSLPPALAKQDAVIVVRGAREPAILARQLTAPGLTTEQIKPSAPGLVRRDLQLLIANLTAGSSITVEVTVTNERAREPLPGFTWHDTKGEHAELRLRGRPVMRYMYRPYDPSKENRDLTYKVFHHLYDPDGKRFVTNGGQTDLKPGEKAKLLFPHHRGLMFAFNKCVYDGKTTADTWHAKPGETHQSHAAFTSAEAGSVLGRHRVLVDWHGPRNEVFAQEERELTVYNVPGGTLVEFAARLKTTKEKLKLDGDPQHAGFQFRAHNDVAAKTAKQTYYLRPDGKGKLGETRNWEPKSKKGPVNLPWDALSFVLDGKRYTVAYLNHPRNPGESRWSERDYGRFGCYFQAEVTKDRPLLVNYRVWLQNREMIVPEVHALHTHFVTPPQVTVK
ncbi:MAG: PmoA family protein [Gemmataceae bacterium]|nr:PmoA family protein [Gemmataceae bacterium]